MTALLTSCGFSNSALLGWTAEQVKQLRPHRVVIITTAARLKEQNEWAQVARKQLLEIGLPQVMFFDYEAQDLSELAEDSFLYVNGGNTFRLMQAMAIQNTRSYLEGFFSRGGLYIGVSAGSAVMGSRIDFLSTIGMDPDDHNWGAKPALGFYKGRILPHAGPKWSSLMPESPTENTLEILDDESFVLDTATGAIIGHYPAPQA